MRKILLFVIGVIIILAASVGAYFIIESNTKEKPEVSKVVKTVFVDSGRMLKRMLPAPQGRAYRVRKRSNHVTIVVDSKNPAAAVEVAPVAAEAEVENNDNNETENK